MMKKQFSGWFIYRWRYIAGYGALVSLYVFAVIISSLYIPGGLTQSEIDSLAITNSLADGNLTIANLPWHALQFASLSLFGVSILTIKLPSIILSVLGAVAIFFLLKRWFKPNITILSMIIMVTTGQFIFLAQNANPDILYVVYSALILLFASLSLQKTKHPLVWKVGLAIAIGLSLYTPYFIFINLGLVLTALLHPYTRLQLFKKTNRPDWLLTLAISIMIIMPLLYLISQSTELLSVLAGYYPLSDLDVINNLKALAYSYFWILPTVVNGQISPILDFSAIALIILGLLVLYRLRHQPRTYLITAWGILTIPILIINPELTSLLTVPLFILLAIGIETLLHEWYKLFPLNPYARTTGLLFTVGLVSLVVLSGIDQFTSGYRFMPSAVRQFNADLTLVKDQLRKRPTRTLLLVDDKEAPIYNSLARFSENKLTVSKEVQGEIGNVIVTNQAKINIPSDWRLINIVTNSRNNDADRLYLYNAPKN